MQVCRINSPFGSPWEQCQETIQTSQTEVLESFLKSVKNRYTATSLLNNKCYKLFKNCQSALSFRTQMYLGSPPLPSNTTSTIAMRAFLYSHCRVNSPSSVQAPKQISSPSADTIHYRNYKNLLCQSWWPTYLRCPGYQAIHVSCPQQTCQPPPAQGPVYLKCCLKVKFSTVLGSRIS